MYKLLNLYCCRTATKTTTSYDLLRVYYKLGTELCGFLLITSVNIHNDLVSLTFIVLLRQIKKVGREMSEIKVDKPRCGAQIFLISETTLQVTNVFLVTKRSKRTSGTLEVTHAG